MAFHCPIPQVPAPSRKAKWTAKEDRILTQRVSEFGTINWTTIALGIPGRTGKQCRERWTNQLSPDLTAEGWSAQDDAILVEYHSQFGNAWSKIAKFLPGRSGNSVKNRWHWVQRHQMLMPTPKPQIRFPSVQIPLDGKPFLPSLLPLKICQGESHFVRMVDEEQENCERELKL
jgi:hypothetical protein